MKVTVDRHTLELRKGDITAAEVDAIVNAANEGLAGGGGVDGAIRRVGGPEIALECSRIGGCKTGHAVATPAGRLKAKHVIHAVAPVWRGGSHGEPDLLASAYRFSLDLAVALGDKSIAFPSLGTGAFGYPVQQAAEIALGAVVDALRSRQQLEGVQFHLYSDADLQAYAGVLRRLVAQQRSVFTAAEIDP